MIPDFAGKVLEIVKLDFGLHLWTEDNWEIDLFSPLVVKSADGSSVVEVDVPAGDLPEAIAFLEGAVIDAMVVDRDGTLGLAAAGREIEVRPLDSYEAWQVAGDNGERLICQPGGELAYFPPTPAATNES